MAIGNAPWPIGVTMVGIHARTGREKIFARNVAHVLNDETQRKYIQVCTACISTLFLTLVSLHPSLPYQNLVFVSTYGAYLPLKNLFVVL